MTCEGCGAQTHYLDTTRDGSIQYWICPRCQRPAFIAIRTTPPVDPPVLNPDAYLGAEAESPA